MLLVIFGAGASYDSDPSNPPTADPNNEHRPPLANALFADRHNFRMALDAYPQCHPIVPRLRHIRSGKSIEEELETLQNEAAGPSADTERARQLAAVRFYLQAVIHVCETHWINRHRGMTNYLTLLDDIRHFGNSNVSLVTFNYDTLLERAVSRITRRAVNHIEEYLTLDPFVVFKVHGSVDWGRVVTGHGTASANDEAQIGRSLIDAATSIQLRDEYRLIRDSGPPVVRDVQHGIVLLPAVAIPVQTKQAFECPPSHLTALVDRLPHVERVLVLGWRGTDRHFVELLRKHLRPGIAFQVACGDAKCSAETVDTLRAAGIDARFEVLGYTFSSYIVSRARKEFLRPNEGTKG